MTTKNIPIKDVTVSAGTQQREVDDDVMMRYAALMKDGFKFPPVFIITDGKNNYLWDGHHRYFAHLRNKQKYIEANVESGTRRDAIYFSLGANKTNAFPRQPGVGGSNVKKMLCDPEWGKMSVRAIADHVGVTERYVQKIQADLKKQGVNSSPPKPDTKPKSQLNRAETRTVNRGGTESEAKVPEKKVLDSTGKQVPEHLTVYFERANEYRQLIKQLNDMLKTVREGKEKGDIFYKFIKIENLTAEINNVKRIFRFAIPFAVCGYCGGDVNNDECRACGGAGFVNEMTYKSTPEEFK